MCSSTRALMHRLTTEIDLEFAVLRREGSGFAEVLVGTVRVADELADIPIDAGADGTAEVLAVVPFRQIRERGFDVVDDGVPLEYLVVDERFDVPLEQFLAQIELEPVELRDAQYDQDDDEYAEVVRRIVEDEIGQGEGANFVIRRDFRASVAAWGPVKALTVFRHLVEREAGAYWTFYVQTKRHALLGASPERHVSSHGGTVRMNPISGTFRIPEGTLSAEDLRARLDTFLHDRKEILELMMVVDEELKMMASICPTGGRVIGPFLKTMSRVVHTEYVLEGESGLDPREVLRKSMFAATVLGSPVGNACRVIKKYEKSGRAHYGSVLALFGHDATGRATLDAPILIRSARVSSSGALTVSVGATLVRDSDPASEVAETVAKISGLLNAFSDRPAASNATRDLLDQVLPDFDALLTSRNRMMAPFWSQKLEPSPSGRPLDITADLVTAEDEFAVMLAHVLSSIGVRTRLVDWQDVTSESAATDLLILGPGPGDPRSSSDRRIARLREVARQRLHSGKPVFGVCLGHQIIASELGLELVPKQTVVQGAQEQVDLFGTPRTVGFYNTFTAAMPTSGIPRDMTFAAVGEEVIALRGPAVGGLQFHPESVLTLEGADILETAIRQVTSASLRG